MAAQAQNDKHVPDKLRDMFFRHNPHGGMPIFIPSRYKIAHGGRGSGKSWGMARIALMMASASASGVRVLCVREYQNSIQESIHKLLSDQIEELGLSRYFDVQKQGIFCAHNRSEFIFAGIKNDPAKIKSTEGIDICLVEEAEKISEESWRLLIPTIRKHASEIWIAFNPREESDPTYRRFITNQPASARSIQINWNDNPWFPAVLELERQHALSLIAHAKDTKARAQAQADYDHVWEGACRIISDAQIFRGKYIIQDFPEPATDTRFFYGADWGFSQDPTVLIRAFVMNGVLFIDQEAYGVGVELNELPALFRSVPGADRWPIKADSSRPETISFLRQHNLAVSAARKWSGSVEDGIAYLRSFREIIIHPRCQHTAEEFRLYSYKMDATNGDILPIVLDKHNHCIDALRYGFDGYIKSGTAVPIFASPRLAHV